MISYLEAFVHLRNQYFSCLQMFISCLIYIYQFRAIFNQDSYHLNLLMKYSIMLVFLFEKLIFQVLASALKFQLVIIPS